MDTQTQNEMWEDERDDALGITVDDDDEEFVQDPPAEEEGEE